MEERQGLNQPKITMDSRVADVYATPIGRDLLSKAVFFLKGQDSLLQKGAISKLKLKALSKMTKKFFGPGFWKSFINLINLEDETPVNATSKVMPEWWKEAVFYQIYPRTFCDSNGDGIGDLKGVISKLDYLKDLGINCLWLSPIYDSPMDDNGYDIRDYKAILKDFGTMEDFDLLLEEAHKRNIRLIMDLVVNHTSDEHEWFKKAIDDPDSIYHDYYLFKHHPNNWKSFFSDRAWNFYPEINEYGLHLFSKKQMDLNWECPELRAEIISMINWWLDKGIDGFRMDVINLISKNKGLPEGDPALGKMVGITGIEHYFYGPKLHEYLKEIQAKAFAPHNAFSVGETPGLGFEMAKLVTGSERNELNMIFSFDHLESGGHIRFNIYRYDLNYYRDYMLKAYESYGTNCWMSLFFNNHDNPKMCNKITSDPKYVVQVQKLLAVMQFTLRGTPFLFQGEEMGLTNYKFNSIDEINDVESKNYYKVLREEKKMSDKKAMKYIQQGSREHGRILLPWNKVSGEKAALVNQQGINEEITQLYKDLIKLRKENSQLLYGNLKVLDKSYNHFTYERWGWFGDENADGSSFIVDINLGPKTSRAFKVSDEYELVYPASVGKKMLPYEARIYRKK